MTEYRITCITLNNLDEERRLTGIGGSCWYYPVETAIQMIKNGERFCVSFLGFDQDVVVDKHTETGIEYLTTKGRGFPPTTLLRLPQCRG